MLCECYDVNFIEQFISIILLAVILWVGFWLGRHSNKPQKIDFRRGVTPQEFDERGDAK